MRSYALGTCVRPPCRDVVRSRDQLVGGGGQVKLLMCAEWAKHGERGSNPGQVELRDVAVSGLGFGCWSRLKAHMA